MKSGQVAGKTNFSEDHMEGICPKPLPLAYSWLSTSCVLTLTIHVCDLISSFKGFPGSSLVKNVLQYGRSGFDPWVGKIHWRREWQPTPVFLPGEFYGQRSLAVYRPWGYEESDTTEQLTHCCCCC